MTADGRHSYRQERTLLSRPVDQRDGVPCQLGAAHASGIRYWSL